jgi:Ala-tRNA(Pro) deacylase
MELQVYDGRPADTTGREEREIRVYDYLDSLQIFYQRTDHEEALTMEDCIRIGEALGCKICKNLFLSNRQQTDFYLLLMPGDKPFKTKELSPQLHTARLSFGTPQQMEEMLDTMPGSASVLGLMNDAANRVQLVIDRDVVRDTYIGCHPCRNTSSLKIRTADILDVFLPAVHHEPVYVDLKGE